jgi:thioredoxin 1
MTPAILFLAFTASWCGPCDQFKADFATDAAVQVLDVEENPELAAEYGIKSYPTVIAVSAETGQELDRTAGYRGRETMKRWMKRKRLWAR